MCAMTTSMLIMIHETERERHCNKEIPAEPGDGARDYVAADETECRKDILRCFAWIVVVKLGERGGWICALELEKRGARGVVMRQVGLTRGSSFLRGSRDNFVVKL